MLTKMNLYLAAGVRLLWLVWPNPQIVEVWEAAATTAARAQHGELPRSRIFTSDDTLAGFAALPDFTCPVSAIFADYAEATESADVSDPELSDE
jgi:Uma2 family endonuclease